MKSVYQCNKNNRILKHVLSRIKKQGKGDFKAIIENFGEYCIGEAEAISQETVCRAYPMGIHLFHSPSNWLNICRKIRHFI